MAHTLGQLSVIKNGHQNIAHSDEIGYILFYFWGVGGTNLKFNCRINLVKSDLCAQVICNIQSPMCDHVCKGVYNRFNITRIFTLIYDSFCIFTPFLELQMTILRLAIIAWLRMFPTQPNGHTLYIERENGINSATIGSHIRLEESLGRWLRPCKLVHS